MNEYKYSIVDSIYCRFFVGVYVLKNDMYSTMRR